MLFPPGSLDRGMVVNSACGRWLIKGPNIPLTAHSQLRLPFVSPQNEKCPVCAKVEMSAFMGAEGPWKRSESP